MNGTISLSKEVSMTRYATSLIVLVLSIFLAGGYQMALSEEGGVKDKALDAKITTSVKTHLATNDRLKTLTQISVKTVDKTVYLTGAVPTQQEKDLAEQVTSKVEHVQKVVNNIEVRP
jgi:osmotically-inducible protein OsmY